MGTEDGPVFHPEMIEDDPEKRAPGVDKMDCFIDCTRLCNASCMAFITYPRGEPKELSEQQAHCALLLFGERVARHMAILTGTLVASEKRNKTADQDRRREQSIDSAGPFASPFPTPPKAKP